ncbi:hypothetical protein B4N89_13990 [Embleya scabrispora]|uniref:Type II toxin-antitoxin system RelE/ParE family toxin n=1 Tax=Embleya scabrispora TaxID=159449 RepID=A0A1T3NYJ3_9ACTN|nr:hypothetical protein [Embleya scabrispora]OPC81898.1 hypothetical protein B4N89_13990 [Embleya scabrispora]
MSPKKGDRVSVPPLSGWNVVFGTTEAATGWEELCRAVLSNAHRCLDTLRTDPQSRSNWDRQHQLRGRHATKEWKGSELEQWEYEITSGGRVRYLVSPETSTVILVYASPRHPKDTE